MTTTNPDLAPRIKTADAVKFFGTQADMARALGITRQAITIWGEYVPALRAFQLRERYPHVFHVRAA